MHLLTERLGMPQPEQPLRSFGGVECHSYDADVWLSYPTETWRRNYRNYSNRKLVISFFPQTSRPNKVPRLRLHANGSVSVV